MARLETVSLENIASEVDPVFREIEQHFGFIPVLFKTAAHYPPLLEANWNKVKAVMGSGNLASKTKEAIAVLVSQDNSCEYCLGAHSMALKSLGFSDAMVEQVKDLKLIEAGYSEQEIALISFACKANNQPHRIPDEEYQQLKALGISSSDIVEALGVMELFAGFNKFLNALEVEPEF